MKSLRIIQNLVILLLLGEHCFFIKSYTAGAIKVCKGTNLGMTKQAHNESYDELQRYYFLRDLYTGCEYVDGNLEITGLVKNQSFDLSFLSNIREVSGYVLIFNVLIPVIPLTSLRIIHGKALFGGHGDKPGVGSLGNVEMALSVTSNYDDPKDGRLRIGLEELQMPKLTEIVKGNAIFTLNKKLCFDKTINWNDIINIGKGYKYESDSDKCGRCHRSCETDGKSHCWGEGKDMCQRLTRTICHKNCEWRCFGKGANQCCHKECAGGCTDAEASNCWACRHFEDNGICKEECPIDHRYDQDLQRNVPQKPKYKYLQQCVDKCPEHLLEENFACVIECSSDKRHAPEGVCKACHDDCPQKCEGLVAGADGNSFLHAGNIGRFANCTLVQGSIRILTTSFKGDLFLKAGALTIDQLSVLESVQEVTDFVYVDVQHPQLTNLGFLKNLKTIHGRNTLYIPSSKSAALVIIGTSLERLDLNSLRHIRAGDVVVKENDQLCYAGTQAYWHSTFVSRESAVVIGANRPAKECEEKGLLCHPQCSDVGCIGPRDDQCMSCKAFRYGKRCVDSCEAINDASPRLYEDSNTKLCMPCNEFCQDTCSGPGPDQCHACSNGRLNGSCVAACPTSMFISSTGDCQPCHANCDLTGCNGEGKQIGPGGCKACYVAVNATIDGGPEVLECLPRGSQCAAGMYMNDTLYKSESGTYKKGCTYCHKSCKTCTGFGSTHCTFCVGTECKSCSQQCIGCTGWTDSDCLSCRHLLLYEDFPNRETNKRFNCTDTCPDGSPNKIYANSTWMCVEDKYAPTNKRQTAIISGVVIGGLLLIGLVIVCILLLRRQLAKTEEKNIRLTAKVIGYVECEPLTPSNAKPDMAVLRLIKESELRRGAIIGSGAFGTVYKGVWIPEGEKIKIPVAIKVLQEGTTAGENRGMLEEARIMASVLHPCCVHVVAVCMTAEMMLITPLMPLGCLLDYVRKNKNNVGSKSLLNWCTQIARGMVYLESRGIIHRDLAARNVLVQSATHVKITDFGLAKLVDEDGQFYAASGKVPIKWLALECIRQRIYTHKSDVWSYGVTIWELFTYGQRPYDNVSAKDVVDLLEKGERLSQPSICTIDIYMIMIKCWMLDADSRPNFEELEGEFSKMARDPGRYLVIQNDSLMRLPSQPTDAVELLRNTSLALDGPEEVVLAEEYVNEIARRQSLQPPINEAKMMKKLSPEDPRTDGSFAQRRTSGTVPEGLRLKTAKINEDDDEPGSEGPRYSPDPCSFSYSKEFPDSAYIDERKDAFASPQGQGSVNRLPLDETEYLQPQSSAPAAYLDLMGEYEPTANLTGYPKAANEDKEVNEQTSLLKPSVNAVSNPEYFNDSVPVNTRH